MDPFLLVGLEEGREGWIAWEPKHSDASETLFTSAPMHAYTCIHSLANTTIVQEVSTYSY